TAASRPSKRDLKPRHNHPPDGGNTGKARYLVVQNVVAADGEDRIARRCPWEAPHDLGVHERGCRRLFIHIVLARYAGARQGVVAHEHSRVDGKGVLVAAAQLEAEV